MDSPVQDPAGQPPANPVANPNKGLRALFHKDDRIAAESVPATASGARDGTGFSAGTGYSGGAGYSAGAGYSGDAGYSAGTGHSADTGISVGSPDRRITRQPPRPGQGSRAARSQAAAPAGLEARARQVVSRPIVNPNLRADPRLKIWLARTIVAAGFYLGFMIWQGWRVGLTAAALFVAADTIYRSRTMSTVPAAARVTAAQRSTSRRLKVLQPAGYLALNTRSIPGTRSVVDHIVVGPAGIFTIDSQRLDRRLPLHAVGGMLYHGPRSMEKRLDHARTEAAQAAAAIAAELGYQVKARPAMVIYGPGIPWVIMTLKGVDVFDGGRVGTYFRRQSKVTRGQHLDSSQIAEIYEAAARALPPLR